MTSNQTSPEAPSWPPPEEAGRKPSTGRLVTIVVAGIVLAGAALAVVLTLRGSGDKTPQAATFAVRRGKLSVTVSEGGALQAQQLERVRSRVERSVAIIYLIPEGVYITDEDVRNGKVLVELDSAEMKERYTTQEIRVENTIADLTKAKEDYQIRLKQNESDIRTASLNAKFARLDLEHYVGKEVAKDVSDETDFSKLGDSKKLGGIAMQKRIEYETEVGLAAEEVQRAEDRLEWTKRLSDKGYVTRNELMADELALKRREADHTQSKYALDLFLQFDLPQEAESRFAEWGEKVLELDRVRARANSEQAQALAKLKSAEATAALEKQQLEQLSEQIKFCTIRATKPGLVVYASSTNMWRRSNNPIEEGVTVRSRQEIIHLPDLGSLAAEVKVHESQVKQIQLGQKAVITVDALPDVRIEGRVKEVAGLPDPQHWLQDVKVFTTIVSLDNLADGLKPGMSCRAEITIAKLSNALYVPVQSVVARGSSKMCYVAGDSGEEAREIETGMFDDKFVEIKAGLREGERVLLNPPFVPREEAPAIAEEEPETPSPSTETAEGEEKKEDGAGQRAGGEMAEKMKKAGITADDMKRWRSGQFTDEDKKKLEAAGIKLESLAKLRAQREGAGGRGGPPGTSPATREVD